MEQRQYDKEHNQRDTNIWRFSLQLGFFAGLIWGGIKGVMYYLKFSTVVPGFLVEPFFKTQFLHSQRGYYLGWLFFIIFSMAAALIYTLLFRKFKGPLPGIIYGIVWWILLFVVPGPDLGLTLPFRQLPVQTNISEFCLYLLWGLFIGYTAAMEYTDERKREPKNALT